MTQRASISDTLGQILFHHALLHMLMLNLELEVYFDRYLLHFGTSCQHALSNLAHYPK